MRKAFLAAAVLVGSLAAGTISAAADEIVGDSSTQTVTNNTTDNVSGNLILGNQSAGNGTYTITGDDASTNITFVVGGDATDTSNPNGALIVGNAGTGTFTQGMADGSDAGNQVNVQGDLALGVQSGSVGIYTLNSGTLSVIGQVSVGGQSTGNNQFIQNGGTLNVNTPSTDQNNPDYVGVGATLGGCASGPSCPYVGALSVGGGMGTGDYTNTGGSGSYTLNNDGIVNAYNVLIGGSGTGTMIQSGTSTVNTTFMTMGFNQETNGTYTLNGGTVNTYAAAVGNYGTGTLTIGDGTDVASFTSTSTFDIGAQQGGFGTVTQNSNSTFAVTGGPLTVGDAGTGTLTQNGGSLTVGTTSSDPDMIVGAQAGSVGSYSLSGGSTATINGNLIIGRDGASSPNPAAMGTVTIGTSGLIGTDPTDLNVTDTIVVGSGGIGGLTQYSGTVTSGNMSIGGGGGVDGGGIYPDGGTGTYTMAGGTLTTSLIDDGHGGTGTFTQTGGTVNANFALWLGNASCCGVSGTYNLNGGTLNANSVDVGLFSTGNFTQNAGTTLTIANELDVSFENGNGTFDLVDGSVTSATTIIGDGTGNGCCGDNYGGSGILDVAAGSLSTGAMTVGVESQGTVFQSGGTVAATSLTIASSGSSAQPVDTYNLTGTGILNVTGDETVGVEGNGNFVQGTTGDTSATQNNVTGTLYVGNAFDGLVTPDGAANIREGSYTLNTGTLTTTETDVGATSIGAFTQTGGTHNTNLLVIGDQNVATASGCGGMCTTGGLAPGTYTQTGGLVTVGGWFGGQILANGSTVPGAPEGPGIVGTLTIGSSGIGAYNLGASGQSNTFTWGGYPDTPDTTPPSFDNTNNAPYAQVFGNVVIGQNVGSTGTLAIAGDGTDLQINNVVGTSNNGTMVVGFSGQGTVTQTDQTTVYLDGSLAIGVNQGSNGSSYTLNAGDSGNASLSIGGDLETGGTDHVGDPIAQTSANAGSGTFTENAGTVQVQGNLTLGTNASGNGTYDLNGGSLAVNNVGYFGNNGGIGTFNQTGGTATFGQPLSSGGLEIGTTPLSGPTSSGSYSIASTYDSGSESFTSASTLQVYGNVDLGVATGTTGSMTVGALGGNPDDPTSVTVSSTGNGDGNLTVGDAGSGNLDIESGMLTVASTTQLGVNGVGTVTQGGGTFETGALDLSVPGGTGSSSYTLSGSGSLLEVNGDMNVGGAGTGTASFTQTGGTVAVDDGGFLRIGNVSGNALYSLSGGALNSTGDIVIGVGAPSVFFSGELDQSGGSSVSVSDTLIMADAAGVTGTYNISGSGTTLDITGGASVYVGRAGTGNMTVSDGAQVTNSGILTVGGPSSDGTSAVGTLTITGAGTSWTNGQQAQIGGYGEGTLKVLDGAYFESDAGSSGTGSAAGVGLLGPGHAIVDGAGSEWKNVGALRIGAGVYGSGASGDLTISNGGTVIDSAGTDGAAASLGWKANSTGTVTLTGGTWTNSGDVNVGDAGTGTVTMDSSSKITISGVLDLGKQSTGSGTFNQNGGTVSDDAIVGDAGTGIYKNTGGIHDVTGNLTLGNQSTGSGTYNLTAGGTTTVSGFTTVGNAGQGTFLNDGSTHNTQDLVLGAASGSNGMYTLQNSGSLNVGQVGSAGFFDVAQHGSGTFTQTSGTTTVVGALDVGRCGGSPPCLGGGDTDTGTGDGTFNLNGGSVNVSFDAASNYGGFVVVGDSGTGTFDLRNNATLTADSLTLGRDGGTGTFHLHNTGGTVTVGSLSVGVLGGNTSTFLQSNGTVNVNGGGLDIGVQAAGLDANSVSQTSGSGDYQQNGGMLMVTGGEIVGDAGTGTFEQTAGTNSTDNLTIGNSSGGKGTYDLEGSGSVLNVSGNENVGSAGTGLFSQTAGTQTVNGTLSTGINGEFDLSGGSLDAANITNNGTLKYTGGTLGTVGTLANNGAITLGTTQNIVVSTDYTNANFGSGNSFNKDAGLTTSGGQIDAAGNVGVSVTGTGGTVITGGTTTTPTLALGNVHVGTTINAAFNVNNTGTSGPVLRGAIQNTGLTAAGLSLTAANFGPIALGGSQAETLTADPLTAGLLSGQSFKVVTNFDNVQNQTVSVTGTAYNLAVGSEAPPSPITIVNQHVGGATTQALTITNTAPNDGFSEKLDASFGANTGNVTNNGGAISLLGPTASNSSSLSVGVDTSSAGHKTGSATVNYVSDGTGTSGLGSTAVGSTAVTVSGNVYRLASASTATPAPVTFANVRVGTTDSQALTLANTAANDGYSESLDASFGGATGSATANGSISLLAAGATDSSSLTVGVDTSSAGAKTGSATITLTSDGTGTSGLGDTALGTQTVNVSGNVYRTAVGSIAAPVVIENQHVGGSATQALSVSNTAANDGFSEKLDASFGANAGNVTNNGGSISLLGPSANNNTSLSVGVDTSSAGAKTGSATVNFTSDGTGTSGLASISAGSQTVTVTGNVYNLASSSTIAPINFGVIHAGTGGGSVTQTLSITNTAPTGAYSEGLDSSFGGFSGTGGSMLSTAGSISNLAAGSTDSSSMQVTLNTTTVGTVTGNLTVHQDSNGTIDGLANTALADQTPSVNGMVSATVTNLAVAQVNTTQPVNFGNVHVDAVVPSQALSITNAAPVSAFTESLIGNVVGTSNGTVTASGGFGPPTANPELAGGASDNRDILVGINTSTVGAKSGNAVIDFKSDGTSFAGGTITDLGNTNVAIQGNVYRLASASTATPAPVTFANVRVGTTDSQALTLANTAANDGYSESLDASFGGATGSATANGSISLLAAGATDSSSLTVGVDTSSAGAKTGSATITLTSDGTGTSGLGDTALGTQTVNVSGNVYRTAVGSIAAPVVIENQHVGGSATQALSVSNTAANDGFSEKLDASFGANAGNVTNNGGSISLLGPSANNNTSLSVGVDTSSAGAKTGSATVNFTSDGTGTSGLASISAGSQTVTVTGNVYNLASSSTIAPINFGVIHAGTGGGSITQYVSITNTAPTGGFSEGLDSSFGSFSGTGGSLISTSGSITNLAAGASNNTAMGVTLNTTSVGVVNGTITILQDSNGTIDGLANTALASQTPAVTGTVETTITNEASPQINNTQPVSFGNVRIDTVVPTVGVSVTNAAPSSSFTEGLIGNVTGTTGIGITAAGGFGPPTANPELAGQQTNSSSIQVGINTSVAGVQSGNAVIDFKSDGTAFAGGTVTDLGNTNVAVTGNVYRLADPTLNTTSVTLAARVGDTSPIATVSITNTSTDAFTEGLAAQFSSATPAAGFTAGGSITNLAAQASDNSSLTLALNTGTAGTFTGSSATVNFTSNGLIDNATAESVGDGSVNLTGKVYQTAVASVAPNVDFGIIHVDQAGTATLTVSNTASGALTDVITGGFSSVTGSFTGNGGTLGSGVAAGGNSGTALQVGLDVGTAGTYTGTANLALNSHDADLTDVALSTAGVALEAQVNNYASLYFSQSGGQGSLSGGGDAYTLNFGNLLQDADGGTAGAILEFLNCPTCNPAFTDLLSSAVTGSTGSGFSLSGDQVSDLAGGASQGGFDIGLSTDALGQVDETLTFDVESSDADFDGVIGDVTLTLEGDIVSSISTSVPEAPSLMIFGTVIFGLGVIGFRRRRKRAA